MSFFADDTKEFLKEHIKVWGKIRDLIGKKFDSEPVYGDKYIRTKIKSYNNDIRTYFHGVVKVIVKKYQKKVAHIYVFH